MRHEICVNGVLLGYVAISAANSLIMGTHARARELALLRLVGTTRRQVLRMMRLENEMGGLHFACANVAEEAFA